MLGIVLGVAGASFAIALPMVSYWYPPEHQGMALGLAGAGNSGTVLRLAVCAHARGRAGLAQCAWASPRCRWLAVFVLFFVLRQKQPELSAAQVACRLRTASEDRPTLGG